MATNFIDEEQWHREHGHKRRFRWVVRRKFIRGPRQPRKVALVVLTPRYDSNFSVTLPRSHITKWYLECGHSALPTRRIGGARGEYEDPEQATVWCNACEVALDTVEETREKEYYWEDGHEQDRKSVV